MSHFKSTSCSFYAFPLKNLNVLWKRQFPFRTYDISWKRAVCFSCNAVFKPKMYILTLESNMNFKESVDFQSCAVLPSLESDRFSKGYNVPLKKMSRSVKYAPLLYKSAFFSVESVLIDKIQRSQWTLSFKGCSIPWKNEVSLYMQQWCRSNRMLLCNWTTYRFTKPSPRHTSAELGLLFFFSLIFNPNIVMQSQCFLLLWASFWVVRKAMRSLGGLFCFHPHCFGRCFLFWLYNYARNPHLQVQTKSMLLWN